MLSLTCDFNYFLCSEPVTLRYRHSGLRNHFVEPVFDEKKGCYRISWESFVYLVEGIVLKDRRVQFSEEGADMQENLPSEASAEMEECV